MVIQPKRSHNRHITLTLGLILSACAASTSPPASSPLGAALPPSAVQGATRTTAPTAQGTTGAPASVPQGTTVAPAPQNAKPIDAAAVVTLTGGKPEISDKVVKVSFPRTDLPVSIDGWNNVPPFMGLTSWAAFMPGEKPGVEAMVMGDLKPHLLFMHIGGEGSIEKLGKGVKSALDAVKAVRQKSPKPHAGFGARPLTTPSKIDATKLDTVLGVKGTAKDGMYKAVMGRMTNAACGCPIGKAMGVNTWAAFAGTEDNAVVDGDFAVSEAELQLVLKALRTSGINIVAIHSHMTGESPRILFLHYWGRGAAVDLAKAVRSAIDLTSWDGRNQSA